MLRETDPVKQRAVVRDFEKYVLDDQAHELFVLWQQWIVPHHAYVKGWKISPSFYVNQDLATIWLDRKAKMTVAATGEHPLLEVRGLQMHFPVTEGIVVHRKVGEVKAVDGIDFTVLRGETLGLVGESGCGKTTTGRCILRLEKPTAGEILYDGVDIAKLERRELVALRRRIQVIFQDPYSSLNPRMKVGEIIAEPIMVHGLERNRARRTARVRELLSVCGLDPKFADRYPHEMSGGQRQRVGIARALALEPEFIVCDEAVSALDVSIQAQVINLLEDLREKFGLTYLFIAHDLSVVRHLCQRVAVMYLGRVVELAGCDELFDNPLHPYSQALLAAVPVPDPSVEAERTFRPVKGEVPSPINPPSGCVFHPRCPIAVERCKQVRPELRELRPRHWVACSEVRL
jgi:oligopeptide transport system ATP-binding protein